MVFRAGAAELEQQQEPQGGEQVQDDQGQQNFHNHGGGDRRGGEPAQAQQTHPRYATADAGHRQQAVDGFAHRGHPQQVAKTGAVLWIAGAQQLLPADSIEQEIQHAVRHQPQQRPAGQAQGL